MIEKNISDIYEKVHGKPAEIKMLGSNFPAKFILAESGDVVSLVKINGKSIEVRHEVQFFGVTPILSLFTGSGTVRVRIARESGDAIVALK
jgi:hypothetical protein